MCPRLLWPNYARKKKIKDLWMLRGIQCPMDCETECIEGINYLKN